MDERGQTTVRHLSGFDRLQLVRRADWRFLLPRPCFETTVYAGQRDAELIRSLELLGTSVTLLDEQRPSRSSAAADVAVAVNVTRRELHALAGALRPGAALYLELDGRLTPRRRLGSLSRRSLQEVLREAGFEDMKAYWHFPSVRSCDEIVPLADETAILHALTRRRNTALVRVKARLARALLTAGIFDAALGSRSVTARRAGDDER